MNGSLGHSFRILRLSFFSPDNSPSLDSLEDLFAVRLPAGLVRVIEKHDNTKRVFEDLLVRGVSRGQDGSMGETRMFFLIGSYDLGQET
jgi:hypothetical protein